MVTVRRSWLFVVLLLITPLRAAAADWALCRDAVEAVEREAALPPGLLGAIARTESGRRNPASGRVEPWPWALNAAGMGMHAASRAEAVATVAALQARGVRSIDVGCLQVNLLHHPAAFAGLEEAFEPRANAAYAARFLRDLQARAGGDWSRAVAWYHSATPERGEPYRLRVMAALAGAGDAPMPAAPRLAAAMLPPVLMPLLLRTAPPVARPDAFAPMLAPAALRIPVFVPQALVIGRPAASAPLAVPSLRPLPRVITPGSG